MARHALDALLQDWADWCLRPEATRATSLLGKLIEQGVQVGYGPTGGPLLRHGIEERIEVAVLQLAARDPDAATALRIEYGVIRRPGRRSTTQLQRAEIAGCCLKTYKTRLKRGRDHVTHRLLERPA